MWLLGRLLPIMIGHKVPEGDDHWLNYLDLLIITDLLLAPELTEDDVAHLSDNIKHVLESLPQFEIPSKKCRSHPDTPANPPMASSLHSSGSPDVGVCCTISVLRFAW